MDSQSYCVFVVLVVITLHSTKCQLLFPKQEDKCYLGNNKLTLRIRRNEMERDELKDTVQSLQKDVSTLKSGVTKPINSGNKYFKDEVDILKREVESLKMQMASFRCVSPGFNEQNGGDYIGGRRGGTAFNDCSEWRGRNITAIRLGCSSLYLFTIQIKYGGVWAVKHGFKSGCDPSFYGINSIHNVTYLLDPSEYITSITGTTHATSTYMQSITFRTNKRSLPRCGPEDGIRKDVDGTRLLYISGRKGCVIDAIQPHWA